jgi:hypothetical protein
MQANDTLILPREVLAFDQSTDHSFASERCAFIVDVEEELFGKCFGMAFYEALLGNRIEYVPLGTETGDQVGYVAYNRIASYTTGDIVAHEGTLYEVLQNTTGTQAIADTRYFGKARKFHSEANEYLWHRYLGRLLAFSITNTSVMYRLLKDTAKGLVKQYDEGTSRPATLNEAMALKQEAAFDVERTRRNMEAYILRNKSSFPTYGAGVGCDDCGTDGMPGTALKNLGFNVG